MTRPVYDRFGVQVFHGDCLDVMRGLESESISAIITDPPSGISFMGKEWDSDRGGREQWAEWLYERMHEAMRLLKPGGHALVWALPRTSHWTALALEDAGFDIRDCVIHIFGQGFAKSRDVSKDLDRMVGAEREIIGIKPGHEDFVDRSYHPLNQGWDRPWAHDQAAVTRYHALTAPSSDAAKQWNGWGTNLKPSQEMWWLCRKPFKGNVAACVLAHGTGALNIDASRVCGTRQIASAGSNPDDSRSRTDPWHVAAQTIRNHYTLPLVSSDVSPEVYTVRLANALAHALVTTSTPGSLGGCLSCHGCDDGRARLVEEAALDAAASPSDAHGSLCLQQIALRIRAYRCADHPSSWDDLAQLVETASVDFHLPLNNGTKIVAGRWPANVVFTHCPLLDPVTGEVIGDACADQCQPECPVRELDRQSIAAGMHGADRARDAIREADATGMFGLPGDGQRFGDEGGASRFFHCFRWEAKAPSATRPKVNGKQHPTVKPVPLLRWMAKLITPPGGLILDCFAGTGTTGQAARAEGFPCILIEQDPDAIDMIRARLDALPKTDAPAEGEPVESKPVQGDLFDLLGGEAS